MQYYTNYIGYKGINNRSVGIVPIVAVAAVKPITAILSTAITLLPSLIPFIANIFQAPAKDARRLIDALKPQLQNRNVRDRLGLVIAAGQKISGKSKDVESKELLLWYRQNYPNDYKTLLPQDKEYFNNYLISIKQRFGNGNNMYAALDKAMFTDTEINVNANPIQAASNILSNITKSTSSLLLYGGIGLGLLLLLKK